MPRPETRGFLERRRARRAPVAAGPERGDAPREGSRGALCSRYASTISRRSTAVSGHKIVAALSTLRLARMEIESTKSENRQRHAVIKKYKDFLFRILEKRFLQRTFKNHQSSRHFWSAQHDTHQLTPCRFSSRLVRPSPVFPSRTPCNLRFTSTAARPPPASRSTFPRRIVASSTARQFRPLAHSRLARRPRATAR